MNETDRRKAILYHFKKGEIISKSDFYKKYNELTGNSLSSFRDFLFECKSLNYIEKISKTEWKILEGK